MKVRPGRLMFLLEIGDSQLPESPVWGESCSMRVTRVLFLSVTKSKKTSFLGLIAFIEEIYIYMIELKELVGGSSFEKNETQSSRGFCKVCVRTRPLLT